MDHPETPESSDLEEEFEEICSTKWSSKRYRLFQQMIQEQLAVASEYQEPICDIEGDQTQLVTLYTELEEVKNKLACLELSTVDEETKRELKRIKNQIAILRAEGITVPTGAQYVPGRSYADDRNKPNIEDYAQGYGGDVHGAVQHELKDVFKEWFKDKREELELPEPEEPQEVDAGFEQLEFNPDRCAEAIESNGEIRQCKNYKQVGSKYCHIHRKQYEEKDVS